VKLSQLIPGSVALVLTFCPTATNACWVLTSGSELVKAASCFCWLRRRLRSNWRASFYNHKNVHQLTLRKKQSVNICGILLQSVVEVAARDVTISQVTGCFVPIEIVSKIIQTFVVLVKHTLQVILLTTERTCTIPSFCQLSFEYWEICRFLARLLSSINQQYINYQ